MGFCRSKEIRWWRGKISREFTDDTPDSFFYWATCSFYETQNTSRHGPKPGSQEAEAEAFLMLEAEAEALTLFKLEAEAEAEALVMKPKPKPKPSYLYRM